MAEEEVPKTSMDGVPEDRTTCEGIGFMVGLFLFFAVPLLALAGILHLVRHVNPNFTVEVMGVEGLDPLRSPVMSPRLNLTVHVDNSRQIRQDCRGKSTVTVSYHNIEIAWAKVPAFCVGRWSTIRLDVPLSRQDVLLPQQLREEIVSDLRVGELELEVEMLPSHPQDAHRPCFLSCTVSRSMVKQFPLM
ncbi:hypothetical protein E2562_037796 [Oryza meyeriana var. granulata]|uniref:Late embryogenesis abundant protein LEA-2 subgroup domain-containing protein n=1 Tax=Oryza meyeriana var. granulata TaxID=110450 RepID=A0A6G1E834_9ORYZ|nr:hypothetical protein E2562_037796 [Oryza meyeriana var. granulata]